MKYAVINLSGRFRETGLQTKGMFAAAKNEGFRYDLFLIKVEEILVNKKISRILVECKMDFSPLVFAGAEAVRKQLKRLKNAGREVFFYSIEYRAIQLYLGSACSKMIINPIGSFYFFGLSSSFLFFKQLLKKNKIETEIIRRGKYKSAADRFRVDSIDDANREQYQAFLDTSMKEIRDAVRNGMGKTNADIDELLNGKILSSDEAVKTGWVDELKTIETLISEWKADKYKKAKDGKKHNSYGRGKKIAVLIFEGAIIDGKSKQDPLMGQAIGSDSYIKHINGLIKNKSVKGVVFRINSGGGSATASEEIVNAIGRLKEKKPVVVSMSEVAGSGGYWIATQAEKIFAERTSLTGSIGVISMLIYAGDILKKYGITQSTLKTGKYADMGSVFRKATQKEKKILEEMIDKIYQLFVKKVAVFRDKSIKEIENAAGGRVWSGEDAIDAGIIDDIGGLTESIEYMKEKLKIKKAKVEFYPVIKHSFLQKQILKSSSGDASLEAAPEKPFDLRSIRSSILFNSAAKPMAIMPEYIDLILK